MTGKELLKLLKEHGWSVDYIKGSHHMVVHPNKPGVKIPVPIHGSQEIPKGTALAILKQAGIKK